VRLDRPSFKYSHDPEKWGDFWPILLMVHGPPPPGIKYYGKDSYPRYTTKEAREWMRDIVDDCRMAIEESGYMSHWQERSRDVRSRMMKNKFLEWIEDAKAKR
jgi:hypothetical protein